MKRRSFIKTAGASAGTLAIGRGIDLSAATERVELSSVQPIRGTGNGVACGASGAGAVPGTTRGRAESSKTFRTAPIAIYMKIIKKDLF